MLAVSTAVESLSVLSAIRATPANAMPMPIMSGLGKPSL